MFTGRFLYHLERLTHTPDKDKDGWVNGTEWSQTPRPLLPNALLVRIVANHHVQDIVYGIFIIAVAGGIHLVQQALCLLAGAACGLVAL